jgi:hypothetical protein
MPSIPAPPRADAIVSALRRPSIHRAKKMPATRSPTRNCEAPAPTATTSPAPSDSGTLPAIAPPPLPPYCARVTDKSRWLSETARTRTTI